MNKKSLGPLFHTWGFNRKLKLIHLYSAVFDPKDFYTLFKQNMTSVDHFDVEFDKLGDFPAVFKALLSQCERIEIPELTLRIDAEESDLPVRNYRVAFPETFSCFKFYAHYIAY